LPANQTRQHDDRCSRACDSAPAPDSTLGKRHGPADGALGRRYRGAAIECRGLVIAKVGGPRRQPFDFPRRAGSRVQIALARRANRLAYSSCSGLGDNAPFAQSVIRHRARHLRSPRNDPLIETTTSTGTPRSPNARRSRTASATRSSTSRLDHEEVEVAASVSSRAGH